MPKLIYMYLSNLLALLLSTWLFASVGEDRILSLALAALVLTVLNYLLRPLAMVAALPFNLISFGIFVLIINAWMVMLADLLVKGWELPGFWASLAAGILVLIFNIYARRLGRLPDEQPSF